MRTAPRSSAGAPERCSDLAEGGVDERDDRVERGGSGDGTDPRQRRDRETQRLDRRAERRGADLGPGRVGGGGRVGCRRHLREVAEEPQGPPHKVGTG